MTAAKRMPAKPERGRDYKFRWVKWATSTDSPLAASERHVCHVLAMYADVDGTNCYPGEAVIAGHVDQSARTVRRALDGIRSHGAAVRVHKGRAAGDSDVYDLTIGEWSAEAEVSQMSAVPSADENGAEDQTAAVVVRSRPDNDDDDTGHGWPPTKQDQSLPTIEPSVAEDYAGPMCEFHVDEPADHSVFCEARRIGA